jgi:cell division septal protein FtsQ
MTEAAPGGGPGPGHGAGAGAGAATEEATPQAPPPRRRARRRVSWRTRFFALAAVAAVGAVAWVLLGDRVFVVRSISVTGTRLVTAEQVLEAADVPIGTPLSQVDAGTVTRRVEAIRQVASATVSVDWPDHVAIAVTERVPVVAVRMADGGYDLVDHDGVIVQMAAAKPAPLPLLRTPLSGAALRGDPGVGAVAAVLAELTPSLGRSVASVSVAQVPTGTVSGSFAQAEQVTLTMKDGATIVWGDPSNAAAKNRELQIVLRTGVSYVNVSAPTTVVTR